MELTTLCALSYPPFSTSSFLNARLRAGVCRIRLMADRLPSKQYVPVRFWYLAPKAVWHHRGQMVQRLPGSVPLCRTAKATPTIRGGRSRLPSGHSVPTHRKRLGRAEPVETESAERRAGRRSAMRLPCSSEGLCVFLKADRRKPKENVPEIQTSVIKGAALADRKFAIVCPKMIYSIIKIIKTRLNEKIGEPPPKPSVIETGWKVRHICGVLPTGERSS